MYRLHHLRWALPFPRTGSALSAWVDCKEQAACSQRVAKACSHYVFACVAGKSRASGRREPCRVSKKAPQATYFQLDWSVRSLGSVI